MIIDEPLLITNKFQMNQSTKEIAEKIDEFIENCERDMSQYFGYVCKLNLKPTKVIFSSIKSQKVKCEIDEFIYVLLKRIEVETGVSIQHIKGKCRKREYVVARGVFCHILRKYYPIYPLREIGNHINRDHATVINAISVIQNDMDTYKSYEQLYLSVETSLLKRLNV